MTKNQIPDVAKISEQLLADLEQAIRGFPRYHKYTLGSDIRNQAMAVVRMCHRAWRDPKGRGQWLEDLVWCIDELKLSLQLGARLQAFSSFRQFESLIRKAEEVGQRAGGWKRSYHRKGQNQASKDSSERAQILSGRAASERTGAKI